MNRNVEILTAVCTESARIDGFGRVLQVHCVEAAAERAPGTDYVRKAGLLVDHDVVGGPGLVFEGLAEGPGGLRRLAIVRPKLGEVKDLDAMVA